MKVEIQGTTRGQMVLEDLGENWKVTVTDGRLLENSFQEIVLIISKDDIKRLAKAS